MMRGVGFGVYFLTSILPKFKWAIIQTYPVFDDSGLEMEKLLAQQSLSKIIMLMPGVSLPVNHFSFSKKTIFVKRKSLLGIFYFCFSKYVFITHGLYYWKYAHNQISVNMWHGMPIKKLGVQKGKKGIRTTYALACAEIFNESLSKAFSISPESIVNLGLPRNFRLMEKAGDVTIRSKIDSGCKNVIIWLPTYRSSGEGDIRVDGDDYGNVVNIENFDAIKFNEHLKSVDAICYVKPHPMAIKYSHDNLSNLHFVDEYWLYRNGMSLYDLLAQGNLLITDASSVVIDFLILDKPIIFSFQDLAEYSNTRGIYSHFDYHNLPGDLCVNDVDLCKSISKIYSGEDDYIDSRRNLLAKYHSNLDKSVFETWLRKIMN